MSATLRGLGLCIDDLGNTFGTSSAPPVAPGTVVDSDGGNCRYMFVYNTGASTISQYYPAIMSSTQYAYVAYDTGLASTMVAGIAMTDIASAHYGWVQVHGIGVARVSAAFQTTGVAMIGGGTYLTVAAATTNIKVAYALGVTTAAGNCPVYLQL